MHYFTITAGRTGTAWLASFFSENLKIDAVHEHLGINDLGEKMPDIRTLRNFNNFGNNDYVQNFWNKKFEGIPEDIYVETNHTLSKCGLVENIILKKRAEKVTLIILKRDIVMQCNSYFMRNDFGNILSAWSWYLHPSYKKKIINPDPFMNFGNLSLPLWYCYEMSARQEYYFQKYSNKINMVEIKLEEVISESGARKFYSKLGLNDELIIPPPKNVNKSKPNNQVMDLIRDITQKINFDTKKIVKDAIEGGFNFN